MEVAKQKTGRKTSQFFIFFFFCILAHCVITFLGGLYYSVTALCKWTELSGNCLFYEIKARFHVAVRTQINKVRVLFYHKAQCKIWVFRMLICVLTST